MNRSNEFASGWGVLLACFLGVMAGFSSSWFYSAGLFLVPVSTDLGLSRGQVSMSPLLCSLTAACIAPFVGRAVDRFGADRVALTSLCGLALSFFLVATFATDLVSYLLLSMVIAILGAGSTSVSFSRMIVDTFDRHRGLALGIMLAGAGCGAMLLPILLAPVIVDSGWRTGYRTLSVSVLLLTAIIAALLWSTRTSSSTTIFRPVPSDDKIWLTKPFVMLGATFFMASLGIVSVIVHFVPMMIDQGLGPTQAAAVMSVIGLALIPGRLLTGVLLDRFPPERVSASIFTFVALGLLLLSLGDSALAIPGAVVTGLAVGAEVDLMSFLAARYFERERYGQAYGGLFGIFLVGGAAGPGLAGVGYDLAGNYSPVVVGASACVLAAAVLVTMLPRWCQPVARLIPRSV